MVLFVAAYDVDRMSGTEDRVLLDGPAAVPPPDYPTAFTHFNCRNRRPLILHDFEADGGSVGDTGWSFGSLW